ncbi:ihfA [Acrasis kona]|uniref:IhfA n=1 Tax=Acrasis kona TaxID=1008807 RepID=A0AAW2YSG8_9EUKA
MDIDLPDGVTVYLVNKYNKEHILRKKENVKTKDAKIPLASLIKEWSMREDSIIWCETEAKVGVDKKGYSDIAFSFMDEVKIKAEVTGLNQMKAAQDFMSKEKRVIKTANSHTADNTQYVIEGEPTRELHPNVERKNVLTSVLKSKDNVPVSMEVPVAKSVTTTGIKPLVFASSPSKPSIQVNHNTTTEIPPISSSPSNSRMIQIKPITKGTAQDGLKNIMGETPMISPRGSNPSPNVLKLSPRGNAGTSASVPIVPKSSKQNTGGDVYQELEQLAGLRDRGIITSQEFEEKKKQLLGL